MWMYFQDGISNMLPKIWKYSVWFNQLFFIDVQLYSKCISPVHYCQFNQNLKDVDKMIDNNIYEVYICYYFVFIVGDTWRIVIRDLLTLWLGYTFRLAMFIWR